MKSQLETSEKSKRFLHLRVCWIFCLLETCCCSFTAVNWRCWTLLSSALVVRLLQSSLYFKHQHVGFPGESRHVSLILRLRAFLRQHPPTARLFGSSRGRRWMRPRPLCFDANQIMFQRCLGVPTPMHINLLCPDLRHKIWQTLQMNWNRCSTCSNKSTPPCGKLWGITPRGKLAAIRQRYCSCGPRKWNRVCLLALFSGLRNSEWFVGFRTAK